MLGFCILLSVLHQGYWKTGRTSGHLQASEYRIFSGSYLTHNFPKILCIPPEDDQQGPKHVSAKININKHPK
jgi:hypothetical protein